MIGPRSQLTFPTFAPTTENSCMKTTALVLCIIHSLLHLFIGPFELIIVAVWFLTGGWGMLILFVLFSVAALSKLAVLVLTFYTTRTSLDKISKTVYFIVYLAAAISNTFTLAIVAYGNMVHLHDISFTFVHIYFINYVFVILISLTATIYVLSKTENYMLIRREPMTYNNVQQAIPEGYYYP